MAVVMPGPASVRGVPPGKHGKSLDPAQNEHVRKLLRELLASPPCNGSQTLLAEALGCSQAHVSNMVRAEEPVGIGFRLAQRAAVLAHISIEEALSGTRHTATVVELDEHYHNRGLAAAAARAMGYPEQAIRQVQSVSLKSDNDLTADEWFDMMRAEKVKLERFAPLEQKPVPLTLEQHAQGMAELRAQAERETREAEEREKARRKGKVLGIEIMTQPVSKFMLWVGRISDQLSPFSQEDLWQVRADLTPLFKTPDGWLAHMLLGNAYARVGMHPNAISELRLALAKGPFPMVKYNLASVLVLDGQAGDAERLLREVEGSDAVEAAHVKAVLAHALFLQEKYAESHKAFLEGVDLPSGSTVGGLHRLATSASNIGLPIEAVELLARLTLRLEERQSNEHALDIVSMTDHPGARYFATTLSAALSVVRTLRSLPASPLTAPLLLPDRVSGTFEFPEVHWLQGRLMLLNAVELLKLAHRWDRDKARPPNENALSAVNAILVRLAYARLVATKVLPDTEGGIGLDFHAAVDEKGTPRRYASFLCDNDGDVVAILHLRGQKPRVWDVELTDEEIDKAISEVKQFLEGR